MKQIMTIAGSDSGGGAGIQADLKTFERYRLFGTSVVTAVTAQNTVGVDAVEVVSPALVLAQLDAVLRDFDIRSIKVGMLGSEEIVSLVAKRLRHLADEIPIVLDPVLVATSGDPLFRGNVAGAMVRDLIPLATVITPNRAEAEVLCAELGVPWSQFFTAMLKTGVDALLVTGGDGAGSEVVDLFGTGDGVEELRAERIGSAPLHGTGCTLSSAIAAGLAHGIGLREAVISAAEYVRQAIAASEPMGSGSTPLRHNLPLK